jgi:hypothetical protein
MSGWLPLRMQEVGSPDEILAGAARRVQRIRLLAEGAESHLVELVGVEVSREDVLEVLGMIVEQCELIELHAPSIKAVTA